MGQTAVIFPQQLYCFTYLPAVHKGSSSPDPHQHLFCVALFMKAILIGVKCYLIAALIGISLMMSEVEHLFTCWSLACCLWENVYSNTLPFFNLFFFVESYLVLYFNKIIFDIKRFFLYNNCFHILVVNFVSLIYGEVYSAVLKTVFQFKRF